MKIKTVCFIVSLLITVSCFAQGSKEIYEKSLPSLVTLKCVDILGYGFFIDKDIVVTNYQVINKARVGAAKAVCAKDGSSYDVLGFIAASEEDNLVLLRIAFSGGTPLQMNPVLPQQGNPLYLFNTDEEQKFSICDGKVREIKDYGSRQFIQFSAKSILTTSGLPVLNEKCETIGILIPSPVKDTASNFAIPSAKIMELLRNKKETAAPLKDLSPPQEIIMKKTPEKNELVAQYLNQGNAKLYAKDYNGAIEKFSLAIRISPGDQDAYVFRGQAKYLLMEFKSALEDFNKAIDLQPDYAEAYDLRGIVRSELGDKTGACEDWNRSYELGFNDAFNLLKEFCDLEKFK